MNCLIPLTLTRHQCLASSSYLLSDTVYKIVFRIQMANIAVFRYPRSQPNTTTKILSSIRSFANSSTSRTQSISSLNRLCPRLIPPAARVLAIRALSSSQVGSSSPPALPDGRDLKHWLVFMYTEFFLPRPKIINGYIANLSSAVGSEEEAKRRIYSMSTKNYYGYGALLSEELANEIRVLPDIGMVILDPFVYEGKKEYQGEPFVNGEAAAYNPKYHDAYVRIHGEEDLEAEMEEIQRELAIEREEFHRSSDEINGVDYKHWIVIMNVPERLLSRDEIIKRYIKTLANVVGSEEEARMKIYSVSTRAYYSFSAVVDKSTADKLFHLGLPEVESISPDSYEDIEKKNYVIVEPFINGEAVPYDPKYHKGYRNRCPEFDWFLNSKKNEHNIQKREPENYIKKDEANMKKRELINISSWFIPAPALAGVPG